MRPQVFLSTPSGCLSSGIHKNEKQTIFYEQKTVYKMAVIKPPDRRLLDPHAAGQLVVFLRQADKQFLVSGCSRQQLGAGAAVQSELDEHRVDYGKR